MNNLSKILKYCRNTISTILVLNGIYFAGLIGIQVISTINSSEIKSQSQLEQYIKIKRQEIDPLNNSNISANIVSKDEGISRKLSNGNYQIEIGGFGRNESTLDHELYHILDGHYEEREKTKSKFLKTLKHFYFHEPKATIYEATGLKI